VLEFKTLIELVQQALVLPDPSDANSSRLDGFVYTNI